MSETACGYGAVATAHTVSTATGSIANQTDVNRPKEAHSAAERRQRPRRSSRVAFAPWLLEAEQREDGQGNHHRGSNEAEHAWAGDMHERVATSDAEWVGA